MKSPIRSLPIRSGLLSLAAMIALQAETHAQLVLTLTATPAAGSPWVGWSGAATGVARTITVTVDQPLTIQANFR
jgi:hypothetical protein